MSRSNGSTMMFKIALTTIRPGLVIVTALLSGPIHAQTQVVSAIPGGATTSLPALQQAYVDAVKTHRPGAVEALFDMTGMTPAIQEDFKEHLREKLAQTLLRIGMLDPEKNLVKTYAEMGAHFPQPVIKTMKVTYALPKGESYDSLYVVASSSGRYFFITAQR